MRRNRGGDVVAYTHDALGRTTFKNLPGAEPDVTYAYDLLGRMISASQSGHAVSFTYDALGRLTSQTNPRGQLSYGWDAAGRRTRITWPDGYHADYSHLRTGEVRTIVANQGTSSESLLGSFGYDDRGRRTSFVRAGGSTAYSYPDANSSTIQHNLPGPHSVTIELGHNPAGQIASRTISNDAYAWTGDAAGTVNSSANGRNQLETLTAATPEYDARGNMTRNDAFSFGYDSENRMTGIGAPGGTLSPIPYDPLGRLVGDGNTTFLMDPAGGDAMVGEYWSTGFIRYVPGAGVDEPIAQVRSTGVRRDFYADERGSVIAVDEGGGAVYPQTYDEYGRTTPNRYYYRFGYTGQARLTRDLYHYKARIYWGAGGRFLQPDPIGYGDGMNLYAYAGGDPVNRRDPTGRCKTTVWNWVVRDGETKDVISSDPKFSETNCPDGGWGGNYGSEPVGMNSTDGGSAVRRASDFCARSESRMYFCRGPNGTSSRGIPARPSPVRQREAVLAGLRLANVRVNPSNIRPLNLNFARVLDPRGLSRAGWRQAPSSHAREAWQIGVPGTDFALKLYIGDSDNGGLNTIAVVRPTGDPRHILDHPAYRWGLPVNDWYARELCELTRAC